MMIPQVKASLERLDQQKRDLLRDLGARTAAAISMRPEPATWSMLDVAEHLMKVERAFAEAVERNLTRQLKPVTLLERIRSRMVLLVMRSRIRVRTPASASEVLPNGDLSLSELSEQWDLVRRHLAKVAGEISPSQATLGVFRHPISGFMNASRAFVFLNGHFQHHQTQLARLRRERSRA